MTTDRAARITAMKHALKDRILVIDGAMGTMIQNHALTEADYRKDRFADHNHDLKGNGDLLSLTQPDIIAAIHQQFLDAGADIVITNTFSATTIAQSDYGLSHLVGELNESAAQLAREVADRQSAQTPDKPRWVAGGIGPTNRTATISPDVNDPAFRNTSFDALRDAYLEAARGLVAGGVDILLIETVFDTLNCKAAIFALELLFEELGERLPVLISGTITDRSGRTLTGQTPEAFWNSICHARPLAMGLNCALGAEEMRPHIAELSRVADCYISAYPNAGLPNGFGGYDETPETTAGHIAEWAKTGLLNMVGGCCGTTPEHIRAIADAVAGVTPRKPVSPPRTMRLSGLEPFSFPVDNSATEVPA